MSRPVETYRGWRKMLWRAGGKPVGISWSEWNRQDRARLKGHPDKRFRESAQFVGPRDKPKQSRRQRRAAAA